MVHAHVIEKAGRTTALTRIVENLKEAGTLRAILIALVLVVVDTIDSAFDGGATEAIAAAIKGVVTVGSGVVFTENFVSSSLGAVGAVTCGVLGAATGVIAGFVVGYVVGMVLDALIDLIRWACEVSEKKYWDKYMQTPIVYRVFVAT